MFKILTWGSHWSVSTETFSFLLNSRETEGGTARLRRAYRRRLAAARAGQRERRGSRRARGGLAQLVHALADHGEHGRHQGVFSGGGGFGLTMETAIPATSYPGELGIVPVVTRGGFGW